MQFKLILPTRSEIQEERPENAGFERGLILGLLEELGSGGRECMVIDGDAINDDQKKALYGEAFMALAHAGNRFRIRHIFGTGRPGEGDELGKGVPALIVIKHRIAIDVYPRQVGDRYQTICDYLTKLVATQRLSPEGESQ